MVKNIISVILTLCFFLLTEIQTSAQPGQIKKKQDELSGIKLEISKLENEISLKTKKEKESYSTIDNYNRQSFLLNKLINGLSSEIQKKENEILDTRQKINKLSNEIKRLKKNYSGYVVSVYKYGKPSELQSIVDAKSLEQAILRLKYLEKFSERREKDLSQLRSNISELETLKKKLEKDKQEKVELASQKKSEEGELLNKLAERKEILASIRNDKDELKKELEDKKIAETRISNLIAKLIEEERRQKEEAERLAREKAKAELAAKTAESSVKNEAKSTTASAPEVDYNLDISTSGFAPFTALKGKLNWPVMKGKIIRKFGENRNLKLNTVTLNYGIDIEASGDLTVKAVAEGVVSVIDWIPGYGSVIIITHKGDYRTVYSHLAEIYVTEGTKVQPGTAIAKIGESLEGSVLHFEIWNSRDKQNPEKWLRGE